MTPKRKFISDGASPDHPIGIWLKQFGQTLGRFSLAPRQLPR